MDAHLKSVEASSASGKYDPSANLALTGIAGTTPEKEEETKKEKDEDAPSEPKEEKPDLVSNQRGKLINVCNFHKNLGKIRSRRCGNAKSCQ